MKDITNMESLKVCLDEAKQRGLPFHIASHSHHHNDMHLHFMESALPKTLFENFYLESVNFEGLEGNSVALVLKHNDYAASLVLKVNTFTASDLIKYRESRIVNFDYIIE